MTALDDINLLNADLTRQLVKTYRPQSEVIISTDTYSSYDAKVLENGEVIFYLETKVRDGNHKWYDSILINGEKGLKLKKLSLKAPVYVTQFWKEDDIAYTFKFATEGNINDTARLVRKRVPVSTYCRDTNATEEKMMYELPFKECHIARGIYKKVMEERNAASA